MKALQTQQTYEVPVQKPPDKAQLDRLARSIQTVVFSEAASLSKARLQMRLKELLEQSLAQSAAMEPRTDLSETFAADNDENFEVNAGISSRAGNFRQNRVRRCRNSENSTTVQSFIVKFHLNIKTFFEIDRDGLTCGSKARVSLRFTPSLWLVKLGVSLAVHATISNLNTAGWDLILRTYNVRIDPRRVRLY